MEIPWRRFIPCLAGGHLPRRVKGGNPMGQPAYQPVEPAHTHGAAVAPVRRTWGWGGLVVRIVLTLASAAAMIVSLFMDWVRSTLATDISVRALIRTSQVRNPN